MDFYYIRVFVGVCLYLELLWILKLFDLFDDYMNDWCDFKGELWYFDQMFVVIKQKGEYDVGIFGMCWFEDGFKVGIILWFFMGCNFVKVYVFEFVSGLVCISCIVLLIMVKVMQKLGVVIIKEMVMVYVVYLIDILYIEWMIGLCLSFDDVIDYIFIEYLMVVI